MRRIFVLLAASIVVSGCVSARYPAKNPAVDYEGNIRKPFSSHRVPGEPRFHLKVDRGVLSGTVDELLVTASGKEIVTCSGDKTIRAFDSATGREKRKFLWNVTDDSGVCDSMAVSHDDALLVAAVNKKLLFYDFGSGELQAEVPVGARVGAMDISPDNAFLATARKGRITLWDMATRTPVRTMPTEGRDVVELALLKLDDRYVVFDVSLDESIHVSDPDPLKGKAGGPLKSHEVPVTGGDSGIYGTDFRYFFEMCDIASNPGNRELAVSSRANNVVWVFGLDPRRHAHGMLVLKKVIRTRTVNIAQLCYSPDGQFLAVESWDDEMCAEVYETGSYRRVAALDLHRTQPLWPMAFIDSKTLAGIGHDDGTFHRWAFMEPGTEGLSTVGTDIPIAPKRSVSFNGNYLAWGTRCCKYDGGFSGDGFDENCLDLENALDLNTLKLTGGVNPSDFSRVSVTNDRYRLELGPTNSFNPDLIYRLKDKASGRTVLYVDIPPEDGWVPHAFGLTEDLIVSGNRSGKLVAYDFEGKKSVNFVGHTSTVRSVSISGSTLVTSDLSGEILLWQIPPVDERNPSGVTTVHPLFTFVVDEAGRYLVIADDGYFAGSYALLPKVWLHVNGEKGSGGARWLGLNQVYDLFYRPDIVRGRLQRLDAMAELAPVRIDEVIHCPPPEITRLAVQETSPGMMAVRYTVTDTGGGIGAIRFYINGKLFHEENHGESGQGLQKDSLAQVFATNEVPRRLRGLKRAGWQSPRRARARVSSRAGAEVSGMLSVKATAGENTVRAVAFNGKNTVQGVMTEKVALSTAPPKKPTVYALVVGIDTYLNKALNLANAVNDAETVKGIVEEHLSRVYGGIEVVGLFNDDATRAKILAALENVKSEADPEDVFLLFVASHGEVADQFYIITHTYAGKNGGFDPGSWLPSSALISALEEIPAQKQLVVFDTCHSGALNDIMTGFYDARISSFTHKAGVTLFSSTQAAQQSVDNYRGSGLLVHLLKRSFQAEPDTDNSKRVSVYEIGDEVQRQFRNIDDTVKAIQQPSISKFGIDFDVDRL
ncbi:caspase family protein [Desulfoluna butyratoxydans]|nr:caspase family protein [Desulfoluna butyratoxydans]